MSNVLYKTTDLSQLLAVFNGEELDYEHCEHAKILSKQRELNLLDHFDLTRQRILAAEGSRINPAFSIIFFGDACHLPGLYARSYLATRKQLYGERNYVLVNPLTFASWDDLNEFLSTLTFEDHMVVHFDGILDMFKIFPRLREKLQMLLRYSRAKSTLLATQITSRSMEITSADRELFDSVVEVSSLSLQDANLIADQLLLSYTGIQFKRYSEYDLQALLSTITYVNLLKGVDGKDLQNVLDDTYEIYE